MSTTTRWPICTRHPGAGHGHVGDEDYSPGSPSWRFVDERGNATCSCCDPADGFPCTLNAALTAAATQPAGDEREAGK